MKRFIGRRRRAPRGRSGRRSLAVAIAIAVAGRRDRRPGTRGARQGQQDQGPKLEHGVLTVDGLSGDDRIVLRLKAGDPDVLEVDADGDGSADFSFDRAGHHGDHGRRADPATTRIRIDESGGAFTDHDPDHASTAAPATTA